MCIRDSPFAGAGIMFDLLDGRALTQRFVVADPRYMVSAPLNAFTAICADTVAFAKTAGSYTGTGAVYFMQISH